LTPSRYVLSNSVGVAAGLAWELKRDDIMLYSQQGELKYGLSYPDAQNRFVSNADFPQWLAEHRQQGPISLILLLPRDIRVADLPLPKPDEVYVMGRTAFIQYRPQ
ncbi:MAG: 4-amino-4-deoxy-L-arabinose lipid A transferase, partial [Kluyvera sp.]